MQNPEFWVCGAPHVTFHTGRARHSLEVLVLIPAEEARTALQRILSTNSLVFNFVFCKFSNCNRKTPLARGALPEAGEGRPNGAGPVPRPRQDLCPADVLA